MLPGTNSVGKLGVASAMWYPALSTMHFAVEQTQGYARRGRLQLAHGAIETPVFMPVGTYGAVKAMSAEELRATGAQIILGNTYHLYLRPGLEVLRVFGDLHRFMHWDGPILTDSGGFQIFSLGKSRKITESGATFKSILNGDTIHLTPELSAEIQNALGSDIAMVLDECVALPSPPEQVRAAMELSLRWAKRFLEVPARPGQLRFGIAQGGTDLALRQESLDRTLQLPLQGIAIGGLSVGEPHEEMVRVLEGIAPLLPRDLPHYLMGVGTPKDLLEGVRNGIDMFDCVLPTRNARNGGFFTASGLLNIRNAEHRLSKAPIDADCACECCRNYSRSYLRHLFQQREILGARLATIHNLHYYHAFMLDIRKALEAGEFPSFYEKNIPGLRAAY